MQPLILTLELDRASFEYFNTLRQRHFPPERNFLGAHVTLFHQLPPEHLPAIQMDLNAACSNQPPMELTVSPPFLLGRGLAYGLESQALNELRQRLAEQWKSHLTSQDKRPFRPHVTVQNKVAPAKARQLHAELSAAFAAFTARAMGALLWRYLGGPWKKLERFPFRR